MKNIRLVIFIIILVSLKSDTQPNSIKVSKQINKNKLNHKNDLNLKLQNPNKSLENQPDQSNQNDSKQESPNIPQKLGLAVDHQGHYKIGLY